MHYFYPEGQLLVVLYFSLVGAGLCLLYDIFRIKREFFGSTRALLFFDDLLYMLMCTLVIVIGILKINSGNVRWYETVFACIGFFLYRATLSRVVTAFFFFLSRQIKKMVGNLISIILKILRPLFLPFKKLCTFAKDRIKHLISYMMLQKYKYKMIRKIKVTCSREGI